MLSKHSLAAWPHTAPLADEGATHLVTGMALPDVALPATVGPAVSLALWPGKSIVFVYPWTGRPGFADPPGWDDIPGAHGSTPEAQGFRAHSLAFAARGIALFGMSGQESAHQQEFAERQGLPFPLLSDAGFRFADALALPRFPAGDVWYLRRLTLAIETSRIVHVFYPVHSPDRHAEEVLAWCVNHPF